MPFTSSELRSLVTDEGELRLTLEDVTVSDPGPDEVIVRVDAAPINPSDLATLAGPADVSTFRNELFGGRLCATARILPAAARFAALRAGRSLPAGNEGAGEVVAAGANVQHLLGRTVGSMVGSMFARYRKLPVTDILALPEGVTARQGAAAFINPLTALGMLSTMRREGHKALVHTAAASNLGQMLNRLCLADGVDLVNIVRNEAQASILREIGATHVINSTDGDFHRQLVAALRETGATIAFDAIGGGPLAGQILVAMEAALITNPTEAGPYGSPVHKQAYIYGRLDLSPPELAMVPGMAWGVGGWLLFWHLQKIGREEEAQMRLRVASEITTTFASHYTREITMTEALDPDIIRAFQRKATGEKFLLLPSNN